MSQILELQIDIMYLLWARSHNSDNGMSSQIIFEREKKSNNPKIGPVSQKRVDICIKALLSCGHIGDDDINDDAEIIYNITDKGINWLEDWFRIVKRDGTFWFHRRREGPVIVNQLYDVYKKSNRKVGGQAMAASPEGNGNNGTYNWTKWGVILTGLSIIVTIILAVIL